jgi:hypothetical protein
LRNQHNRKPSYFKDQFATAYDTTLWDECEAATGAVSIVAGSLKLNCPVALDVAALVSKVPLVLRNARISVAVDCSTSTVARAGICLAQSKVTVSNPESENNILSVCLDDENGKLLVKTNVAGAGAKTLYNENWTAESETLRIDIEPDGLFTVYEGSTPKFVGTLPFTNAATLDRFKLYIYLYAVASAGNVDFALLDNFDLDFDDCLSDEASGQGVRRGSLLDSSVVLGRLYDLTGNAIFFQTSTAIDGTPTQTITLSRDVKKFRLEEIRFYMNPTAAETYQLLLFEASKAADVESLAHLVWLSPAAMADVTRYQATRGGHLATGAGVQANDPLLPVVFVLERPGQVWFNQGWSGAPGATPGFIVLIGREVD